MLASSTDGSNSTADFTISVEDADEYDVTSLVDNNSHIERSYESADIGTLASITAYAEDLDGSDSVSYTLSDDAGGLFAIAVKRVLSP